MNRTLKKSLNLLAVKTGQKPRTLKRNFKKLSAEQRTSLYSVLKDLYVEKYYTLEANNE